MFSQPSKQVSCGDLSLTVRFLVPPKVLVEALTNQSMVQVLSTFYVSHTQYYTQSPCKIVPQAGGDYILYDGAIQGQFISIVLLYSFSSNIQSDDKIELKWRRREWEDGVYSIVTFQMVEISHAVTEVSLVQKGIPKFDKFSNVGVISNVQNGWIEMIFRRIGQVLGYVFQTEDEFEQV